MTVEVTDKVGTDMMVDGVDTVVDSVKVTCKTKTEGSMGESMRNDEG